VRFRGRDAEIDSAVIKYRALAVRNSELAVFCTSAPTERRALKLGTCV
jgi:hypothetical protein